MKLFHKSAERLELLHDMMERTGSRVDADFSSNGVSRLKSTIVSCLACRNSEECKLWLEEVEGEVAPPEFCANAQRLKCMR